MNYAYGKALRSTRASRSAAPVSRRRDTGDQGDVTHAYKATVVYDLPFGQGRRFGSSARR